jgi:type II secretory pathway component PulF
VNIRRVIAASKQIHKNKTRKNKQNMGKIREKCLRRQLLKDLKEISTMNKKGITLCDSIR